MEKLTLVLFSDETQALQGLSALAALQREGSSSVRGAALLERDDHGLLLLRKDMTGTLLGGGLGAVVARAPSDLLQFLARDLAPKTFALIAETRGEWLFSIESRMEPLGGRVVSEWRTDSGDDAPAR
jgi:hypothetical protein